MQLKFVCVFVLLAAATPGWSEVWLSSWVSVPNVVTYPPPEPLQQAIISYDNLPISVSSTSGDLYASAFAQSNYGVLRASVSNYTGLGTIIYRYESHAQSLFMDDIFLDVPVDQQWARVVFSYNLSQTHATDVNSWEQVSFVSMINSRRVSPVGSLGIAHCGTGPGGIGYGEGYGAPLNGLDIPLSATCTLDAPVNAGEQVKLELYSHIVLTSIGYASPSGLDATHTVKVVSTGWVNSAGTFTAAPFTGASGATYPPAGQTPLYNICLLYDPTKAVKSGSTIPIKLQLCDGTGNNRSGANIAVHAISLTRVSDSSLGDVQDSGNANPDNDFHFDSALGGTGGYIFNLSTKGLAAGTYKLTFTVTGDSLSYAVQFQVK
ncbi:MAG: PxKF domain-containing protein [Acidobacteriia bacterium]|nr:PxKF domain-containing protein [Terriglobia bacterium]